MEGRLIKSILQTLTYFDLFDHPLTAEEVFRYLWEYNKGTDYAEFLNQLEQLEYLQNFDHKKGFYFLAGREVVVAERQRRIKLVESKLKIARRGIKKLRYVPFVRAVFVCNTLALGSVTEKSDIDVFVVTRKGRIWLARFFCNLFLRLCRLRTSKKGYRNKVCLSFFVTDNSLNLADLQIGEIDVYLIYWISLLMPVYDPEKVRERIIEENAWIKEFVSQACDDFVLLPKYRVKDARLSRLIRKVFETMWGGRYGDIIERQAKSAQAVKIKKRGLETDVINKSVVISDSFLKFHENDRRRQYQERWRVACQLLINGH
jgi:hypothetical protein